MSHVGDFGREIGGSTRPRDREVARIANRQYGVVAFRQLRALGFGPDAIQHRLSAGRLHQLHVGVYAVGHRRVSRRGRWIAAVLAHGPKALLSHRSAAMLWGMLAPSAYPPEVTTARRCSGMPGIVLHRSRRIDAEDRAVREGIPLTSVSRTLLDLAEVVPRRVLDRAIEQAELLRVFDQRPLDRLIARSRGRHGLRPLRAALGDYQEPAYTRSGLERRFLALCRKAGLPRPAANMFLEGMEVDMSWPERRLVVELDGGDTHRTRAAFERDRIRDTALQLAGYRVLRITDRRLKHDQAEVVRAVRSLLDRV